ncbi:MAG: CPBP family intramembrane metalloprotease [Pirellulales bacterium]|nr:CPBP family intramembrane metalloprotease [Pirellulales bacterium]
MQPLLATTIPLHLIGLGVVAWAAMVAWVLLLGRWWKKQPVLPLEPRVPVPWRAVDVVSIVMVFLGTQFAMVAAGFWMWDPDISEPLMVEGANQESTSHTVEVLLRQGGIGTLVLCLLAAVVVAPIVEEILFRLFLQGWLESVEARLRPVLPTLARFLPWGVTPVVLTSVTFAMVHFRTAGPPHRPEYLVLQTVAGAASGLIAAVCGLLWVRAIRGATAADLGWAPKKLGEDLKTGLTAAAAVVGPLLAINLLVVQFFPKSFSSDPLVLFPFALVLGTLYCRTHRILPSIITHAALNATSLLLFWLAQLA